MARRINSRLKINGTLQAETPLHVGGYGVDVETDLPLARNGRGELYIPGTSLTGVLRAWCARNFGENPTKELFGFQEKDKTKTGTREDKSHASFVLIEDAIVTLPNGLPTEIRDGVGIDRIYGTAADKSKFDRAILPKGSTLGFEMIVEIEVQKKPKKNGKTEEERKGETEDEFNSRVNETKTIIGNLLSALTDEEIRFGASKTRGLGRVKLIDCKIKEEKFTGFDEETKIANILKLFEVNDGYEQFQTWRSAEKIGKFESKQSKLKIEIEWQPTLPLMNKAGYEGIGVDMLPVTSGFGDEKLALVLAGSSIKGAFRSHAERIMRTLLNCRTEEKFNDQIDEIPIVENLFGARKKQPRNEDNEIEKKRREKLGLGALSIDDCYSVESFNQKEWHEVEQASADENDSYTDFFSKLDEIEKPNLKFHPTHHTAIDRFTSGVADGALYSVLAPHNIKWQPIEMSLDLERIENKKASLMLLLLVLRDFAENRLPLGFATNRGMGEVEVKSIKLKGKILDDYGLKKNETGEVVLNGGKVSELDENFRGDLAKEWKECLKIN